MRIVVAFVFALGVLAFFATRIVLLDRRRDGRAAPCGHAVVWSGS